VSTQPESGDHQLTTSGDPASRGESHAAAANIDYVSAIHGVAVERRVRHVAAVLGVPEFVYVPPLVRKSGAIREVGDGILLCGAGGAVLQVKARGRREGRRDSDAYACRWIKKHVERAVRQGRGSKRTIMDYPRTKRPLRVTPVRSMVLSSDEQEEFRVLLDRDCAEWPIIVVVDHPKIPEVELPFYADAFCCTLDDWRQLNQHLRSTHQLLRYVDSVLTIGSDARVPLGHEVDRFSRIVAHESAYVDAYRGQRQAVPAVSFVAAHNPVAINRYRQLLERTWGPNDEILDRPIEDYRDILDVLDDVPASVQEYVGLWLEEQTVKLHRLKHRISGTTLLGNRPLIYMADLFENRIDKKNWLAQLWSLVAVRAVEWREQMRSSQNIVGVGIRVLEGGRDEYSFVLMRPTITVPDDFRMMVEWTYGFANFRTFETVPLKVGRNEFCPCGSTKKFKRCHGSIGNR
jgi:hypothetical protein